MSLIFRPDVDLSLIEPEFLADVMALLATPHDWLCTFGYRSLVKQDELYKIWLAGGPKAAPPGRSAHNFGLAVDVVLDGDPVRAGTQPEWNIARPEWQWLFSALKNHPRLHSGVSFKDGGHIERFNWQDYTQWNAHT